MHNGGMTKYRLLSVNPFLAVCAACGTECPERHLVVADEAGNTLKLGTTCAYRLTGVKPTDRITPIEVEVTDADRQASADFMMSLMNMADDDCDAGLLPAGTAFADPCVLPAGHAEAHRTAAGVTWSDQSDDEEN